MEQLRADYTSEGIAGFLFIFVTAGLSHFFFSPLGFNPTDDGFILAYSRRILDGQVPHRDFISIRPILSAIVHAPEMVIGRDHTFLTSRFVVWLQFASMAWLWVWIMGTVTRLHLGLANKVLLALITFTVSVHTFPIMAWHTIDGLFFISIGLAAR